MVVYFEESWASGDFGMYAKRRHETNAESRVDLDAMTKYEAHRRNEHPAHIIYLFISK